MNDRRVGGARGPRACDASHYLHVRHLNSQHFIQSAICLKLRSNENTNFLMARLTSIEPYFKICILYLFFYCSRIFFPRPRFSTLFLQINLSAIASTKTSNLFLLFLAILIFSELCACFSSVLPFLTEY